MRINRSTERTIDIIRFITARSKAPTLAEVSKSLKIPKSSALEILNTLAHNKILEMEDKELKTFGLGLGLLELTMTAFSKNDLLTVSRPLMETLSAQTSETVILAVEDRGEMVFLEKVEGPSMIRATARLGSRTAVHSSALGKAFLAGLPDERVTEMTGGGDLLPYTRNTIRTHEDLLKDLCAIRQRGFAIDNEEYLLDIYCLGVPVYDHTNNPIAAISIPMQSYKMDGEKQNRVARCLADTAFEISKRLGFMEAKLYFNRNHDTIRE